MTRTECIPPNPNHYVGNHPLINSDQLDQHYPKPEDSRPVFPSPLDDASFRKGTVDWQPSPCNRKSLERATRQISEAALPGGENVIDYLQDQYRRNCKAATIRSAAEAICCFLVFLKGHAIGKLEDIRRQHIGAFVEHEQDRGLKVTTVRQRLQNVYAFMRYLSREDRVVPELLLRKIHLKLPQRLPRAIPAEDVLKLLSVIDHVRNRAIIPLLLRTGVRIGGVESANDGCGPQRPAGEIRPEIHIRAGSPYSNVPSSITTPPSKALTTRQSARPSPATQISVLIAVPG